MDGEDCQPAVSTAATRSATFSVGGDPSYKASTVAAAVSCLAHPRLGLVVLGQIGVEIDHERLQILDFPHRVDASFPELIYPERHENADDDDDELAEQKTPIETSRHIRLTLNCDR